MKKFRFLLTLLVSILFTGESMAQDFDPAHWMEQMVEKYPDVRLSQLSIPGAHDAATWYASTAPWKDQVYDEKELFAKGVRYFDMRIGDSTEEVDIYGNPNFLQNVPLLRHGDFGPDDINDLNNIYDEIMNHFPDAESLGKECLIIFARHEGNDLSGDKLALMEQMGYGQFIRYLVKKYGKDRLVHFKKDIKLKDLQGKILLFSYKEFAKQGWKDIYDINDKENPIKLNIHEDGLYPFDVNAEDCGHSSEGRAQTFGNDYDIFGSLTSRETSAIEAHQKFWGNIDASNSQNYFSFINYNGYLKALRGGSYYAFDDLWVTDRGDWGLNHRMTEFLSGYREPTGIVSFDFCGVESRNFRTAWGDKLVNEIIRHNFLQGRFLSDLRIGENEEYYPSYQFLENDGYTIVQPDLNNGAGGWFVYLAEKFSNYTTNAISDIILAKLSDDYSDDFDLKSITYNGKTYERIFGEDENYRYPGNLNAGTSGDVIYLFAAKAQNPTDDIITGITISKEDDGGTLKYVNYLTLDDGEWEYHDNALDVNKGIVFSNDLYLLKNCHKHDFKKVYNQNGHMYRCTGCGNSYVDSQKPDHEFAYYSNGTMHTDTVKCTYCDYKKVVACVCEGADAKGIGTCANCKRNVYEPCSWSKTLTDTYEIKNMGQLYWFNLYATNNRPNVNAVLTNDIVINEDMSLDADKLLEWQPICNGANQASYCGTFDGGGHTISGLYCKSDSAGLFHSIENGTVKNLGVINSRFDGKRSGTFAFQADDTKLSNVFSTAQLRGDSIAGIAFSLKDSELKNSYFYGDLQANTAAVISYEDLLPSTKDDSTNKIENFYAETNLCKDIAYEGLLRMSKDQFANGEVCFFLNYPATGNNSEVWHQKIGTNDYPIQYTEDESSTIYGGYKHGQTTDLVVSNSSADACHTHIYDATAETEAEGNHDKSYVQSGEHPTYRLDDESGKAFAQWTLKCSVCNDELPTVEVEATKTEGETDEEPTCTQTGRRYLTSTYKLRDDIVFTDSHYCVVDALGHDFSGKELSSKPDQDSGSYTPYIKNGVYSYVCPRDGAHSTDKVIKNYSSTDNLVLHPGKDGYLESYTNVDLTDDNQFMNVDIRFYSPDYPTYTRTMKNQWGTLSLPFAFDIDESKPYDFYKISSVTDNTLTLFKVEDKTIYAGTCLLVRVNGDQFNGNEYVFSLTGRNKMIAAIINYDQTVNPSHSGLSLKKNYANADITNADGYIIANNTFWNIHDLAYDEEGNRKKTADGKEISVSCLPFHAYLSGILEDGSSNAKKLNISTADDDTPTAVQAIDALTSGEAEYYDLNGRRLNDMQQGVNIIKKDGKSYKVIIK